MAKRFAFYCLTLLLFFHHFCFAVYRSEKAGLLNCFQMMVTFMYRIWLVFIAVWGSVVVCFFMCVESILFVYCKSAIFTSIMWWLFLVVLVCYMQKYCKQTSKPSSELCGCSFILPLFSLLQANLFQQVLKIWKDFELRTLVNARGIQLVVGTLNTVHRYQTSYY